MATRLRDALIDKLTVFKNMSVRGTVTANSFSGPMAGNSSPYPADYPGVVYYVNNISGSDSNTGLSWTQAFAQIATAVALVDTFHLVAANANVRCAIFVQGTATAYTALTALPSYCDIIGVGAMPYGDGAGIPVISGKSASAPTAAVAGTARGLYMSGFQLETSGAKYCLDFVSLFRSEIAFCAFKASDPTLATLVTLGGIRFTGNSGGNYIHDNMWMGGNDSWFTYGIVTASTVVIFNFNRIENNDIQAETAGVLIAAETVTGDGTKFKDNDFSGGNHTMAVAVDDNSTRGRIQYSGNRCGSTDGGQLVNNGAIRWVGNYRINNFSTVTAS
jgi:hypothetical protein